MLDTVFESVFMYADSEGRLPDHTGAITQEMFGGAHIPCQGHAQCQPVSGGVLVGQSEEQEYSSMISLKFLIKITVAS